eukprot:CCRYP_008640-RA/>CCRYP_008640-RA protein AED:0.60 eAED:-0.00 QI:0/0/0/0.2/1/1/5/0/1261
MFSPSRPTSAGTVSGTGGSGSVGGGVTMDQLQALLTATIQQMGGTLADALKNVKSGNDKELTAGVKVEVQRLKDDRRAKVLEHIQLVISTATLRGFGHAFDAAIAMDLPERHDNKEGLDLSDPRELKMYKAVQANDNAMAWLRMAFPIPKHQHEIDASCSAAYPQGVAYEAIRCLKARVIPAKEMAATVLQAELDSIKMKETEDPQSVDDKFNELARLYTASGSVLTASMKKAQLMKIMPSLYSGCINTANQAAQSVITANAFNALAMQINAGTASSTGIGYIDMEAIECTYEQLQHAMQVRFQQLCVSQPGKFKKDGITSNKSGNGSEVSLGNVEFKGTCYNCNKQGHKASDCRTRRTVKATISKPAGQIKLADEHSRANATNAVKRGTKEPIAQRKTTATTAIPQTQTATTTATQMAKSCGKVIVNNDKGSSAKYTAWKSEEHEGIVPVDVTDAFMFASNHFAKSQDGAYNCRETDIVSQGMTGGQVGVSKLMDFTVTNYTKNGKEGATFKMTDVSYNAQYNFNLFSVSRCLVGGWSLTGEKDHVKIIAPCGTKSITFDLVVKTPKGAVYATVLKRHLEVSNASVTREQMSLTLAQAHYKLGHTDVEKTRRTAKALGWDLTDGVMTPCASCASGKAKQRRIPKKSERERASKAGQRWYHDISTISDKDGANCPKKQWHLQHDEFSRYSLSSFYKHKDEFIEPMCAFMRRLADKGMAAEYIRMDNSGENKKLVERATGADWKLNPKWEFTARSTPQQNGLVEVEFATIAGRARAMCNAANMNAKVRILVANEVLSYSTAFGNLVVDKDCRQTRYERMGLKNPKWAEPGIMRTFGEAGVVKRGKNGKLGDRGIPMVFVGYAENHSHDCYRMWYPTTRKVTESQDVIWLHRMYYQDDVTGDMAMLPEVRMAVHEISNDSTAALKLDGLGQREPGGTDPVHDDTEIESVSSDNQPEIKVESEFREGEDDAVTEASDSDTEPERKTRSGRVVRVPQKYDGFEMTAAEIRLMQVELSLDYKSEFALIGATGAGFKHMSELHVMNYKQAMASADAAAWQQEVDKEHERMVKNDVWDIVPKSSVPPKTKILKSVWAMKPKADGTKRARLNAKGCSQIPGQHYDVDNISSPKHFKCDDVGKVKDYIGCKLDISSDGTSLKMTQPVLVQSLSDEFEDIPQGRAILVPAKPGNILTKCENSPKLSPEKHSRYRTGVGKLLYLTKHSRPDIANAVRELSRHCHDPTEAHWEAMCDCIRKQEEYHGYCSVSQ